MLLLLLWGVGISNDVTLGGTASAKLSSLSPLCTSIYIYEGRHDNIWINKSISHTPSYYYHLPQSSSSAGTCTLCPMYSVCQSNYPWKNYGLENNKRVSPTTGLNDLANPYKRIAKETEEWICIVNRLQSISMTISSGTATHHHWMGERESTRGGIEGHPPQQGRVHDGRAFPAQVHTRRRATRTTTWNGDT